MNSTVLFNHVAGTTSQDQCELLFRLGKGLSEESTVLDINCNFGRSTISLCLGLLEGNTRNVKVVAWDPHLTTLESFIKNLSRYKILGRVIPIIHSPRSLRAIFNKRSISLITAQIPNDMVHDSMVLLAESGAELLKKDGSIVLLKPQGVDATEFEVLCSTLFTPETGFKSIEEGSDYRIYKNNQ